MKEEEYCGLIALVGVLGIGMLIGVFLHMQTVDTVFDKIMDSWYDKSIKCNNEGKTRVLTCTGGDPFAMSTIRHPDCQVKCGEKI